MKNDCAVSLVVLYSFIMIQGPSSSSLREMILILFSLSFWRPTINTDMWNHCQGQFFILAQRHLVLQCYLKYCALRHSWVLSYFIQESSQSRHQWNVHIHTQVHTHTCFSRLCIIWNNGICKNVEWFCKSSG